VQNTAIKPAVNNLITAPKIAANIASFSVKSEFSPQITGIWPKITEKGKPEEARTNEPKTKAGSIPAAASFNWAMASVGEAKIDTIPVLGSMENADNIADRPSDIGCHTPIYSRAPIIAKIAPTAGIINKNNSSAPSLAAPNKVGNGAVLGVKDGNSFKLTLCLFFV